MKIILDTKRLIIREFEDDDINALMLVVHNPEGCELTRQLYLISVFYSLL